MAFLIFLLLAFVGMPFFALGLKRLWLFAAIFWVVAGVYTVFFFQQPVEEQEEAVWRLILLAVLGCSVIAFAGGILTAKFKSQHDPDLEETFE